MSPELVQIRNCPSETGARLGEQIARLTPATPAMCGSCAFRLGTYPNRCAQTGMDAIECVLTGHTFYCHVHTDQDGHEAVCAGFLAARGDRAWGEDLRL